MEQSDFAEKKPHLPSRPEPREPNLRRLVPPPASHQPSAMAQANISVTESQFRCPICLDLLKDPVSIPCGHTYCMSCVNDYWDRADPGPLSCPQCRETFSPRPVLRRNTVLAEVVERLQASETFSRESVSSFRAGAGEVPCDFCPARSRLAAVKSCLACLASFCEVHVAPHREVGTLRRHKLVPAVDCLAERLCAQHRLALEPAGGEGEGEADAAHGWTGDCVLCEADREEVNQGSRRQTCWKSFPSTQLQLRECQRVVQVKIRNAERELEEFQQNLETLKVSASAVLEDSEALFADMAARLEKTRNEVRARMEAKERAVVGRAERDVETFQKDLQDLRTRDEEISRLLQTEDNEHFLQEAPLLCLPPATGRQPRSLNLPPEAFSGAQGVLGHFRSRMEELCRETMDKISRAVNENHVSGAECFKGAPVLSSLTLQPADQRMRAAFLRFACRLSFDPNTAHPTLVLLETPQSAHCGEEPQSYPPHPQRFDSVAQVLCREGQFGGASYWEVEWTGGGWIDIGVTYRGIGRKGGGKPCLLGRNENSWRLRCTHAGYAAWHENRKTTVAAPPCPRIGVFIERGKETLSFYSVSDTVMLLHTFRCPFAQPLYPAFRLDLDSTLLICPLEASNGSLT